MSAQQFNQHVACFEKIDGGQRCADKQNLNLSDPRKTQCELKHNESQCLYLL